MTPAPATHRRRPLARRALAAGVAAALVLGAAACSDDASGSSSDGTTKLVVGAVPTLELGLIELAEEKGYLAEEGLEVEVKNVDSGPNVVTGVVAGQYDLGATAYAPPLLALGQDAPLKHVLNTGVTGEAGTNGSLLVKKGSGIASWADLEGKKIGSNAPRSLFSLVVPEAIEKDGGDGSSIEIVPIPFAQAAKAVNDGQVDAAVTLEPFTTAGLEEFDQVEDLGDPLAAALPDGSPQGLYFTSEKTASSKAEAIEGFEEALRKAITDAQKDPALVKKAGAPQAGLTEEQALALPDTTYVPDVDAATLEAQLDLMVKHGWLTEKPDLAGFLGRS